MDLILMKAVRLAATGAGLALDYLYVRDGFRSLRRRAARKSS